MKTIQSRTYIINTLLVVGSILITLFVIEIGYRTVLYFFIPDQYAILQKYLDVAQKDESLNSYKQHPYLSYVRSDTEYAEGGIKIRNRLYPIEPPKDRIRVVCLGGSTTRQKYPVPLRLILHSETEPPLFEVMDFGCDGWTLQESLINYTIRVQDFSPDIVILHHGANDAMPRIWGEFKPDYTNFRTHWNDQTGSLLRILSRYSFTANGILQRRGFLVHNQQNFVIRNIGKDEMRAKASPKSAMTYRRNLESMIQLTKLNGSHLILANMPYDPSKGTEKMDTIVNEHNQIMQELAQEHDVPILDFATFINPNEELFSDAVHMTPDGDKIKAQETTKQLWQWYWNHPERLEVGTIQPRDDTEQKSYQAERTIEVSWNDEIANVTDYHIYVKEQLDTEYTYLGKTVNHSNQSFLWNENSALLNESFKNKPEMMKHYQFKVFAIQPDGHVELGNQDTGEIIHIQNRIKY